ncbi:hypothetical protein Tco_0338416, partial [Tanacetum coccineum]
MLEFCGNKGGKVKMILKILQYKDWLLLLQQSTAEGVNTGSIKVSTGDEKLSTGDEKLSTGDEQLSTGNEQVSTIGAKKSTSDQ